MGGVVVRVVELADVVMFAEGSFDAGPRDLSEDSGSLYIETFGVLKVHVGLPEYEAGGKEESAENVTDAMILSGTTAATPMLLKSTASSGKTEAR